VRILVKIGGRPLESVEGRRDFAASVAAARQAGHEILLVHGGGKQLDELGARLGIEERRHRGLRICDEETAELALMVLGGQMNRRLVLSLQRAGIQAIGLSGADGDAFQARPHQPEGQDLGYVGEVAQVNADLLCSLMASGLVPVLATVAPLEENSEGSDAEAFYNINADQAAGPIAAELACDTLLFLSDIPGVMRPDGKVLKKITPFTVVAMEAEGSISAGMLPKLRAACEAGMARGEMLVKIAAASGADSILAALEEGAGTWVYGHGKPGHG
jgi:acetylglutamate kinase